MRAGTPTTVAASGTSLITTAPAPITARSRGLGRGTFYTLGGSLVASCAQEGLVRMRRKH